MTWLEHTAKQRPDELSCDLSSGGEGVNEKRGGMQTGFEEV